MQTKVERVHEESHVAERKTFLTPAGYEHPPNSIDSVEVSVRKRIMNIITLINCLVVVAFLVCLKAGSGIMGEKHNRNEGKRREDALESVCVCVFVLKLFSSFSLLMGNKLSLEKLKLEIFPGEAYFSNGGGCFRVKYLSIHEFL